MNELFIAQEQTVPKFSTLKLQSLIIAHTSASHLGSPADVGQVWLISAGFAHEAAVSWPVGWGLALQHGLTRMSAGWLDTGMGEGNQATCLLSSSQPAYIFHTASVGFQKWSKWCILSLLLHSIGQCRSQVGKQVPSLSGRSNKVTLQRAWPQEVTDWPFFAVFHRKKVVFFMLLGLFS